MIKWSTIEVVILFSLFFLDTKSHTMIFKILPIRSLDAGPEFYNSMSAPHNCVGGSENGCLPGEAEAHIMFVDPSKMAMPFGVPKPSSWYKDSQAEFL